MEPHAAFELPDLDSNQEPAGYETAPSQREGLDEMERHRRAKTAAHTAVATTHVAPVTPIRQAVGQ